MFGIPLFAILAILGQQSINSSTTRRESIPEASSLALIVNPVIELAKILANTFNRCEVELAIIA